MESTEKQAVASSSYIYLIAFALLNYFKIFFDKKEHADANRKFSNLVLDDHGILGSAGLFLA